MARAQGLAICPDDVATVPAGAEIKVEMLEWPDDHLLNCEFAVKPSIVE